MKILETNIPGVLLIEPKRFEDERGFFADTLQKKLFDQHKLPTDFDQCCVSFSKRQGTLRGMHYQTTPAEQFKILRCTRGAVYDAVVDLRKDSPAYKKSFGVELNEDNHLSLAIPGGIAHGFLTLKDNSEIVYQITGDYSPQHARGVRWDDPAFQIRWPFRPAVIAERDANYPDYDEKT